MFFTSSFCRLLFFHYNSFFRFIRFEIKPLLSDSPFLFKQITFNFRITSCSINAQFFIVRVICIKERNEDFQVNNFAGLKKFSSHDGNSRNTIDAVICIARNDIVFQSLCIARRSKAIFVDIRCLWLLTQYNEM